MSIKDNQEKTVKEFSLLEDWEAKYKKIIEKGKQLPALPQEFYVEKFKVKGCQSQVWLHAYLDANKNVIFEADSDALIVKGLIAVLLEIFSGHPAKEIAEAPLDFIKNLGLESHLSPSRSNGLFAMIKQIKTYAQAFLLMQMAESKG